jgi:membrane protein YqaA with SNARE-associated domain
MTLETAAASQGLYAATLVVSLVSGFVPLVNTEAYLLGIAALVPGAEAAPIVLLATAGQMAAKTVLFLGGRAGVAAFRPRGSGLDRWRERLTRDGRGTFVLWSSALLGLPPFYALSVAAGALRWPYQSFAIAGTAGRLLRFSLVFLAPRAVQAIAGP